VANEQTLILSY